MKAHSQFRPDCGLLSALGQHISKLRKKKRLTIEEFADKCGLHPKYIQTIETGKRNVSISVFIRIANALNIPPTKFLGNILS